LTSLENYNSILNNHITLRLMARMIYLS